MDRLRSSDELTFESLLRLGEEVKLGKHITPYEILQICEKSLVSNKKKSLLWLETLIPMFTSPDQQLKYAPKDKEWMDIFIYLEKIVYDAFTGFWLRSVVLTTEEQEKSKLFWLNLQNIFNWFLKQKKAGKLLLTNYILFKFGLDIFLNFLHEEKCKEYRTFAVPSYETLLLFFDKDLCSKIESKSNFDLKFNNNLINILNKLCDLCELWSPTNSRVIPFTCRAIATASMYLKDTKNAIEKSNITTDWMQRPIYCILIELYHILIHFQENREALTNSNFIEVAKFYVRMLKVLLTFYTNDIPSLLLNKLSEVYATNACIFKHKDTPNLYKNNIAANLLNLLSSIYYRPGFGELMIEYCKRYLAKNFLCSGFVFDYLSICIKHHKQRVQFIGQNTEIYLKLFQFLLKDAGIYVNVTLYNRLVEYFVVLLILDMSGQIHQQFCCQVLESNWIIANTSSDILKIYYRYSYKYKTKKEEQQEELVKLVDNFWLNCLQNRDWYYFRTSSFFVQCILRTLSAIVINKASFDGFKKLALTGENCWKVWLTACRTKKSEDIIEYFKGVFIEEYFNNPLGKAILLDDSKILEMINILEIFILIPKNIDKQCWQYLVNLFYLQLELLSVNFDVTGIKSSTSSSLSLMLKALFNGYLKLFCHTTISKMDEKVICVMEENLMETEAVCSVFILNYLLERKHIPMEVLQKLQLNLNLQKIKFILKQRLSVPLSKESNRIIEIEKEPKYMEVFLQLQVFSSNNNTIISSEDKNNDENIKNFEIEENHNFPLKKKRCLRENDNLLIEDLEEQKQSILILQQMQKLSQQLLSFSNKNINKDNKMHNMVQIIQDNLKNYVQN